MSDDFPNNSSTTAQLFVDGGPLLLSADFEDDSDWTEIIGLKRFHHYTFRTSLPPDPLEPISGWVWAEVYNGSEENITRIQRTFQVDHEYTHFSTASQHFVGFVSNTEGNYQVEAIESDVFGDTRETAFFYGLSLDDALFGSITSEDDIDMFRVNFSSDVEYQIDLFGDSSNSEYGTTLGNPHIRILDENQELVADNNSGQGTDAKLSFRPTTTGRHYISVSGLGTEGSYFLRVIDDHANTRENGTQLQVGQTTRGNTDYRHDLDWVSSAHGVNYQFSDPDWFQLDVIANFHYDLSSQSQFDNIAAFDSDGNLLFRESTPDFSLDQSQTVYVTARGSSEYQLTPVLLDDHPATFFAAATTLPSTPFHSFVGSIERADDRDLFNLRQPTLYSSVRFDLSPYGDLPLEDAYISFYNGDREFIGNYSAHGNIVFRMTGDASVDPYHALIYSAGDNIGSWELSQSYVDTPGTTATGWNVRIEDNGRARIRNAFESGVDVDYHRVSLRANTWYEIETENLNNWAVQRPNGALVESGQIIATFDNNESKYYFRSLAAGDHYFVARSPGQIMNYEVRLRQSAKPDSFHRVVGSATIPTNYLRVNNVFRFGLSHEIYSQVPLKTGDRTIPANTLSQVTSEEAFVLELADPEANVGDIYVRPVLSSGEQLAWNRLAIVANTPLAEVDRYFLRSTVRFTFNTDRLTDYAVDTGFSDISELSENEKNLFRTVAEDATISYRFIEQDADSHMVVFKADLGSDAPLIAIEPTTSNQNDEDSLAGDIVLNTGSSLFETATPASIYRLLNAIGTATGLPQLDDVDRTVSVMGTQVTAGLEDVFPTTMLPADLAMFGASPAGALAQPESFTTTYLRLNGDTPLLRTVYSDDPNTRYSITATASNDPVSIDLRPGANSVANSSIYRSINNGHYVTLDNGLGGFANDGLTGNYLDNRLAGFGGNDVLLGGGGNDILEGGLGDDYYVFRPAHNQDVIREASFRPDGGQYPAGGTDVVRYEGMYDHDAISEDFTFSRLGNDLVIRLELNHENNVNGDSIRITDMHDPERRVEAFALLNTHGFVERISLASVFEQADEQRRRFEVLPSQDAFGSLVRPV